MRADPRNRAMPLLDVILLPDDDEFTLVVMPLLREFDTPPFARRAEVIEALRQFLQVRGYYTIGFNNKINTIDIGH